MSTLQRPARPCKECQRRKLRCDAQQPKCGLCQRAHVPCEVSPAGKRGPKRGHLNALRNRLVQLEETLQNRLESEQRPQEHAQGLHHSLDSTDTSQSTDFLRGDVSYVDPLFQAFMFPGPSMAGDSDTLGFETSPFSDQAGLLPRIDRRTHAELDQLYFDRVHPSFPILHKRRYLGWSKSTTKSRSQACLQQVMWILAILLSTQSRDLIDPLYSQVRQDIDLIIMDTGPCQLELVQAWTLLTVCELMRAMYGQAWASAGRMFRLLQGLRYHEIDSPRKDPIASEEMTDNVRTEEKRRVFWMAFLIDHLLSIRNRWPVTLSEHMARYPGSSQINPSVFLSEAVTESPSPVTSSFNECIIIVTLSGRGLLRDIHGTISEAYGGSGQISNGHDEWLNVVLASRNQALRQRDDPDRLGTFAQILGQVAEILLCKSLMTTNKDSSNRTCAQENRRRALSATEEIVRFAQDLTTLHFSMVHPFMFIPLFVTAEFLYENRALEDGAFLVQLQSLVGVFDQLTNVNDHEKSYLDLLSKSCISSSRGVLEQSTQQREQQLG
ncbi:unnamed protein product [Clonostachys rosea]|uniref:Zn(2)-C6 fungal-type domain-containing protein n=1 Tax=Bionectria ochroleuca TaxID=29856 RepID=A0ABY6U6I3_BIOOC|nr:unnamed protein product [Clonostachys rosea]